jgi:hypothetical protein
MSGSERMIDLLTVAERRAMFEIDDYRPTAWVIADSSCGRADLVAAGQAAGLRITQQFAVATSLPALTTRPDDVLVLADLNGDMDIDAQDDALCLLDRIDMQAFDARSPAIVSFGSSSIDVVAARVTAPFANLLCAPTHADIALAIGLANRPVGQHLAEADSTADAVRLQRLADEVARIARVLAGLAEPGLPSTTAVSDGLIGYRAAPVEARRVATSVRAEDVRTILRLRRQRDRLFGGELFADPAWDMMLDLLAARIERLKVAVSSLCIAAAVPPTTALRWIRTLTELGIFVRVADPTDGRRVFIELSDAAAATVLAFIGEAKQAGSAIV